MTITSMAIVNWYIHVKTSMCVTISQL